ncbi:ChaN family lipoprotein [Gaetbulibacter aestuarii]|uniref:ChaN family lipoprotein n=1 Tax=Gaetbulibacter aestuarii TaxID=1502358 RepID=A0ABW7MUD8_9FLAO
MKKTTLVLVLMLLFLNTIQAQHKYAYKIYTNKGKSISYGKMIKKLDVADVVFFGEFHNNSISHWLQLELVKDRSKKSNLVLGAEMFEADQQSALNDYLEGKLNQKALDTVITLWPNYHTDYKPLVDFAMENKLPFIATNIPRRFANEVYKKGGFEALVPLTQEQKEWMAPLPIAFDINLPQYQNMLKMMGDHGTVDMVKAQAMKDATMAYFISKNLKKQTQFIHFNGSYHSNYKEGIVWYLHQYKPSLEIKTITTVEQENIEKLDKENFDKADFIICVDADVTKTY